MSSEGKYPNGLLWAMDHLALVLGGGAIIILLIFLAGAYYVENRLDHIEENITFQPPRGFEPVDLTKHAAGDTPPGSMAVSETVYVPVYSHIYYDHGRPYPLETTLSIRNTDRQKPIFIRSVHYYDTRGKLVKENVTEMIRLAPLETIEFLVETKDSSGGSGANFIVEWSAQEQIDRPIIETVMVGKLGATGIGFTRSGQTLSAGPSAEERK